MTLATIIRRFLPGTAPASEPSRPLFPAPSSEVLEYGKSPACLAAIDAVSQISFDAIDRAPKPAAHLMDQREAFVKADLKWQIRYVDHQIRLEACKTLGLAIYTDQEAADLLVGKKTEPIRDRSKWRAVRHASSKGSERHFWGLGSTRLRGPDNDDVLGNECCLSDIPWEHLRSFTGIGKEMVCLGLPEDLRYPISLGAVLRMQIAKEIQICGAPLFHGFAVVAPESCWAVPEKKDPLLFGVILGPINRKTRCFEDRFALLARWE